MNSHRQSYSELQHLPIEELVAIFREAFATRQPSPGEPDAIKDRYFIGIARHEEESAEPLKLEAVGYPDPAHYGKQFGPDWGLCQSSPCATCAVTIRSNVKHALCPICDAPVYLT